MAADRGRRATRRRRHARPLVARHQPGRAVALDAIQADAPCVAVTTIQVRVDITHAYRGDVGISLTRPDGTVESLLLPGDGNDPDPDVHETFDLTGAGEPATGEWLLTVTDQLSGFTGTLDRWSIGINQAAP